MIVIVDTIANENGVMKVGWADGYGESLWPAGASRCTNPYSAESAG